MINEIIGRGNISFKDNGNGGKYCYLEIRYIGDDNKKHRKYIRGDNVRDACAKGDEFIARTNEEIANRDKEKIINKTFNEFCSLYLNDIYKNIVQESTYIKALSTFKNYVSPYIGEKIIKNITSFDVAHCINTLIDKNYSLSVVKKAYQLIDGCFNFGVKSHAIQFNPATAVEIPKSLKQGDNSVKFYTSEEMELIRAAAIELTEKSKIKYGYAVVLMLYGGMRVSEMLGLTWDNVDFDKNEIYICQTLQSASLDENGKVTYKAKIKKSTKTKSGTRRILLHKYAREALLNLYERRNSEFVVSTSTGNPVSVSRINKNLLHILNYCGINTEKRTGSHTMRHSFATQMVKQKMSSESLAVYLGHSSDAITKCLYVHDKENTAKSEWETMDDFNIPEGSDTTSGPF